MTKILLIVGNSDPYVSLEDIVQSTEYLEKFNVKVVQGASHFPHQEKPDSVNEAIVKFLVGELHVKQRSMLFLNVKCKFKKLNNYFGTCLGYNLSTK